MKKLRLVFAFVAATLLFAACEEAIDLKDKKNIEEGCCHDEEPDKDSD